MGFASIRFHGGSFVKLCGRGIDWDHRLCCTNGLMYGVDSRVGFRLSLNASVRKPETIPRLGFVKAIARGEGDTSGDDPNLVFAGRCLSEIWGLLQKTTKELEVVKDLDETVVQKTVLKEAVRNATVALPLIVTKVQDLLESIKDTPEVSADDLKHCEKYLGSLEDELGRLDRLMKETEGSLDLPEAFQCLKEAETAVKSAVRFLFGSQSRKIKQGGGTVTVLNVEYNIDDDGKTTEAFVEAVIENSGQPRKTSSLYERALNLKTLCHLVVAAREDLKAAQAVREAIEEVIESTSIIDVIRHDEAVAWEQQARKNLDEASKAVKRLEDLYFGTSE